MRLLRADLLEAIVASIRDVGRIEVVGVQVLVADSGSMLWNVGDVEERAYSRRNKVLAELGGEDVACLSRRSTTFEHAGHKFRWDCCLALRSHVMSKKKNLEKLVERINSISPPDLFRQYVTSTDLDQLKANVHDPGGQKLEILLTGTRGPEVSRLVEGALEQCLDLVQATSADDYRNSEMNWSKSKKRKEMNLPDMRYLILLEADAKNDSDAKVAAGFVSFMITYEDGHEVIYTYEVHLAEAWQGRGLGKKLMQVVESVGRRVGVEKSMLTVFKANQRAVKMYDGLGYREDEYSPGPRQFRDGSVKEPTYIILSKKVREET